MYAALQQPSTASSRTLFLDAGCDGLKVDRDTVDVVYRARNQRSAAERRLEEGEVVRSRVQQKTQGAVTEFSRVVTLLRASIGGTDRR